ncbi:hypothetical protein FKR81_18395 [Lentzea tibetensis]|uniref:Uncharacterized protein n=1 Tax=Lentzea tibetensis TaxID=2591470 RepID=A0A563EU35_9PSEU|nr:hypothetical protein [Lentzea tibetensis]TWP51038.1 hypothetical protein FKR81_18395 [Lentzea tibetensis]
MRPSLLTAIAFGTFDGNEICGSSRGEPGSVMSHSRTEFAPATARVRPPLANAALFCSSGSVVRSSSRGRCTSVMSHRLMSWSLPAVAMVLPSGLSASVKSLRCTSVRVAYGSGSALRRLSRVSLLSTNRLAARLSCSDNDGFWVRSAAASDTTLRAIAMLRSLVVCRSALIA